MGYVKYWLRCKGSAMLKPSGSEGWTVQQRGHTTKCSAGLWCGFLADNCLNDVDFTNLQFKCRARLDKKTGSRDVVHIKVCPASLKRLCGQLSEQLRSAAQKHAKTTARCKGLARQCALQAGALLGKSTRVDVLNKLVQEKDSELEEVNALRTQNKQQAARIAALELSGDVQNQLKTMRLPHHSLLGALSPKTAPRHFRRGCTRGFRKGPCCATFGWRTARSSRTP
jgi:hypothetical protein